MTSSNDGKPKILSLIGPIIPVSLLIIHFMPWKLAANTVEVCDAVNQ